ncbi:hypothetical protein BRC85_08885 [Halobacteriales archaeon QS_1_69_70]|nr:MAG: hypothetical protein BRC85_08885 [Halobacteriales archaeon QS_1_69_70]
MHVTRRTLLSAAAGGAAATAGCSDGWAGGPDDQSPTETDRPLPDACPTTQNLGVEWPAELTDVESFMVAYENAYYREVVVDYEPTTRVDEYGLEAVVSDGPTAVDGGYEVALYGTGGVYEPGLHLQAEPADPPAGADVVPVGEVSDDTLRDFLETAAAEGEAETVVQQQRDRIDELIERVAALSDDAETLDSPGDSATAYVDVDGSTVELTLQADRFHGDYWWSARYYVDKRVVRRVDDEESDPREAGDLLECREQS